MRGRGLLAGLLALTLAACAGSAPQSGPEPFVPDVPVLYRGLPAGDTRYANDSLAELLATLTHETEWGGRRPHLVRYEEPVTVGIDGPGAGRYRRFLEDYFAYLRRNAQVDIRTGEVGRNLFIRFVPGGQFRRLLPAAACVLVSGDTDWSRYAAAPDRVGGIALLRAERIERMTIFLPDSAVPYRVRSCLLEEIAQALGPVNDLYGLGPSIFNDDFAHLWPTALDLMMLRVLYDRTLATGLDRAETVRRARAVLDRVNPAGRSARPLPPLEPRGTVAWRKRVERVVSRSISGAERMAEARAALDLAEARFPNTAQHCHSLILLGRVLSRVAPAEALDLFERALAVCRGAHGPGDVRLARIRLEIGGARLAFDQPRLAAEATRGIEGPLADHGLDERLAALYALRADAYARAGDPRLAAEATALSEAWARYALGR